MSDTSPPRWAERGLTLLLPEDEREGVLGDLAEEHAARAARGPGADGWYRREVLRVGLRFLRARFVEARRRGSGHDPRAVAGSRVSKREREAVMDGFARDLRHAARVLRRSPGFTVVAVLSLALGIGANAAMFGVVRTLVLKPLEVDAPEELAIVAWQRESTGGIWQMGTTDYTGSDGQRLRSNVSSEIHRSLQAAAPDGVELFSFHFLQHVAVGIGDGAPILAGGLLADGHYFSALRVPMALGRGLSDADDAPGAPTVAVLGHAFWLRTFGGDPGILGTSIRVNGVTAEVIGVTQPGFKGLSKGGFWPQTDITVAMGQRPVVVPLMGDGEPERMPRAMWIRVMARVSPEVDRGLVETRLAEAFLDAPGPVGEAGEGPFVLQLVDGSHGAQNISAETERLLFLLMGVVASVLLIACVNLASLLLGRGVARQREMAVRRALGGGRARLVRQHLTESFLIAASGTALGLGLAIAARPLLGGLLASSLDQGGFRATELAVSLDPIVVLTSVSAGLATTLVFGLLPALRLGKADAVTWLKQRTGVGEPHLLLGRILIAGQIAITLPLVMGALLLLQTVNNLGAVQLGFETQGVSTFVVDPELSSDPARAARMYRSLLAELEALPGVQVASLIGIPLVSGRSSNGRIEVGGEYAGIHYNRAGPGYLKALGIPLVSGRTLGLQDDGDGLPVAVVNETAVREVFGGKSPLGRIVRKGDRELQIVGVIGDTPYRDLRQAIPPVLYESALQVPDAHVIVRTSVPVRAIEPQIREAVRRVDPELPVPEIREQTAVLSASTAQERVLTRLMLLFGAFTLLLASIGLHGVTAYAVERRTSEIGVRVAVGARPGDIVGLVLRQVVVLTVLGLAVGVPLALAGGPLIGAVLYGVAPGEPLLLISAALTLVIVSLGAGLIPAARAARIDALEALRSE